MGAIYSFLFAPKDVKKPLKGCGPRIKNLLVMHHKGIFGSIVPMIFVPLLFKKMDHAKTVMAMWAWMFWFFLLQPVSVPVTGLIPIFFLPMTGALSSDVICSCYMNEGIAMFILSNMVLLLWNNSGLDRRIILWFLCSGDVVQCSGPKLVLKSCMAGFFLSMFSNKLIVSNILIQYITPIMMNLQSSTSRATDANFDEMRYVINNAIQTSCSIGGIAFIHSSYATLAFRTIFQTTTLTAYATWHDIFNYLEFTSFAMPTAIAMFILNLIYHIVLVKSKSGKIMSAASMTKVRTTLWNHKKDVPSNVTLHEKMTLFFSLLALTMYFGRWCKYFNGWAKKFVVNNEIPGVRDATVAALFVILLHSLPNGFRFIKIWCAKKKSQFGVAKPESGILWWRFVDKNIVYGYLFLIGSGVALSNAALQTRLTETIKTCKIGKIFNEQSMKMYLLLVTIVAVILPNIMSSVAAVVVLLPFVMKLFSIVTPKLRATALTEDFDDSAMRRVIRQTEDKGIPDIDKIYLGALAVGLGGSFGFMNPFLYTPAYFCHFTGKVPRSKMACYGFVSALICTGILWACLAFYAPILWKASTIKQVGYGIIGAPAAGPAAAPAAPEGI